MEAEATRAEYVYLRVSKDSDLEAINQIPDGAITDVAADLPYLEAIYKFYRAGIICGSDETAAAIRMRHQTLGSSAVAVRILDKEEGSGST